MMPLVNTLGVSRGGVLSSSTAVLDGDVPSFSSPFRIPVPSLSRLEWDRIRRVPLVISRLAMLQSDAFFSRDGKLNQIVGCPVVPITFATTDATNQAHINWGLQAATSDLSTPVG